MANSLGIDFNPQPAYGSNPFEPVVQGLSLGLGLNREIQNQQMEQQKFQQDSEMEREKMKLLKFGQLADLYDKTKTESLRASYYNRTLRPFAKQGLGVDLPEQPDEPFNKIMSGVAEAYSQFKKGDLKEKEYGETLLDLHAQATIARDKESASQIENLIKVGRGDDKEQGLRQQREIANQFRLNQEVIDIGKQIDQNPILRQINKEVLSLGQMETLRSLVDQGNTVAFSALGTKMARAMGEVGVLTETDIIRYVQSGRLDRKAGDTLSRWLKGKPTDATISELNAIGDVLKENYDKKIQSVTDQYVNRLSRNFNIPPEDAAYRLSVEYGGQALRPKPGSSEKATLQWNPKTGKLEKL